MNLAGKILTVIVFVMSVVFAAFAVAVYSAHRNYKEMLTNAQERPDKPLGVAVQLAVAQKKVADLQGVKSQLETDLEEQKNFKLQQLAKLEHEAAECKEQATKEQEQLDAAVKAARDDTTANEEQHKKIESLEADIAKLRADIDALEKQRKDLVAKAETLTEELHETVSQRIILQERNGILTRDYTEAQKVERY